MKLLRYASVAIESILANKLRSGLTMLGLFIGVVAILLTVTAIRFVRSEMIRSLEQQDGNLLTVYPKFNSSIPKQLTGNDERVLADPELTDYIAQVSPVKSEFMRVTNGAITIQSQVTSVKANYFGVKNLQLTQGRLFGVEDEEYRQRVVVLSQIVAQNLFDMGDAVGKTIRIKSQSFQVIGVLEANDDASMNQLRPIYVPLRVAQTYLLQESRQGGDYAYDEILVQVARHEGDEIRTALALATEVVSQTLRARHDLGAGENDDFDIFSQQSQFEMIDMASTLLNFLLGGMGAVSAGVGGIGIMNIMLVSVTERTGEIGLRKALGAHDRDIYLQFLIEAVILCVTGSLLGIFASYVSCLLVKFLIVSMQADISSDISIGLDALLFAVSVGGLSGFVFGVYPARRATLLDPIEALRYE